MPNNNVMMTLTMYCYTDNLKQRLISIWAEFKHSVINKAIDQWRPGLRAYIRASGQHFEQLIN